MSETRPSALASAEPTDSGTRGLARLPGWASRIQADVSLVVIDALVILGAYGAILVLRFDGLVPTHWWARFWVFAPIAVLAHLASNWVWRLYHQVWKHASVEEARKVALAGATAAAFAATTVVVLGVRVPASVVLLGALLATALMGAIRFQSRLFAVHRGAADGGGGLRIAVIGAGEAGAALVREMLRSPDSGFRPVVLLDDDRRKQGRTVHGIPIVGRIDDLATVAAAHDVHQLILAVPSGGRKLVRRVANSAAAANLPLRVAPVLADLIGGSVSMRDVRDVQIEDLLGREQVHTDLQAVSRVIQGRRVLITGAGGSIGSEIARQVAAFHPAHLAILDHDETHLHDLATTLANAVQVLADIRDYDELREVFRRHRPEVVFHAAAHKHVPILEMYTCQAVATNVLGTLNVVECAREQGVQDLVCISTDKAVRPTSVMGASKWLGEQLLLDRAPEGSRFCAVRFGNVLGSRGSVIPMFARQIQMGGPVTVTDPAMTRFFMSIPEAVQLVLQSAAFAQGNEIFMLDMGEPVNILELARRMIRLSGFDEEDIPIEITGVRSGEKLIEELRAPWEGIETTLHPAIHRLRPLKLSSEALETALEQLRSTVVLRQDKDAATLLLEIAARPDAQADPRVLVGVTSSDVLGPLPTSALVAEG